MLPLNISSSSLPQMIGGSVPADSPTVSLGDASNASAVIVYDFMLEQEVMPPLPSSGLLKLNVVLNHDDPSCKTFFAFKINRSFGAQVTDNQNQITGYQTANYQTFTPNPELFKTGGQFRLTGNNLTGYYDSKNQSAEMINPSDNNTISYHFIKVMAVANAGVQGKGILIGTFDTPNWTPPAPGILGAREKITKLYGTLDLTKA